MTYNEISERAKSTFINELRHSFMHTSNPLQRISRTAIARLTLIKIYTLFNDAIQSVFPCVEVALRIFVMPNGDKLNWRVLQLTAEA